MKTIVLLTISNIFMTFAWYGHLKYRNKPLVIAIFASWLVALFEYVFQVPANRIGAQTFSLTQLKIMQECITLVALFEYVFQVPANRIGAQTFSLTQLKIMQECITLVVFTVIAYLVFGQSLKWNNLVSYVLIVGAVYFSFAY